MIRCIGLVIETRPDYSGRKEANLMLKLGCTRVELGVQSVFDDVLNNINRGHGVKEIIESTKLLKDFGFKVTYHYMLGLPGSNREKDVQGFKLLFGSQDFQPDMLKIYPCVVTRGTKLFEDYKKGKYKPLDVKETAEIISELKKYVPSYVRIMRIQRDIPSIQIEAGPDRTNLRQYVQAIMTKKGIKCKCIRCMETDEVGEKYNIFINSYLASCGREYFISSENQNGLFGFCRLRFPFSRLRKEITRESALIRELHVYGDIVNVGGKAKVQHRGIGKRLLEVSEEIAKHNGIKKMIIISGIGVRDYYKNLGYKLEGSYMIKKL